MASIEPETFDCVSQGDVEIWQTNWKLAMENAMESYHLFKVHETTLEPMSPTRDAYYIAGSSEWSLTGGVTKRQRNLLERLIGSDHDERLDHYILVQLAPAFVGVLTCGSFGWLSAHPIDADTAADAVVDLRSQPLPEDDFVIALGPIVSYHGFLRVTATCVEVARRVEIIQAGCLNDQNALACQ